MKKYLVKYRWASLFDKITSAKEREDIRIEEAESVNELVANFNKRLSNTLDYNETILEIYELGELKYKGE